MVHRSAQESETKRDSILDTWKRNLFSEQIKITALSVFEQCRRGYMKRIVYLSWSMISIVVRIVGYSRMK